jgi:hypothetical protein
LLSFRFFGHTGSGSNVPRSDLAVHYSITLSARPTNVPGTVTPNALGGLQVDRQLELGRLLDWDVSNLSAVEKLGELSGHKVSEDVNEPRSVTDEAAFLHHFGLLIHSREAHRRGP